VAGAVAGTAVSNRGREEGRPPGSAVGIAFEPARDLAAIGPVGPDTTWLRGATSVVGRVIAERGDTLLVAVSETRGSAGTLKFPPGKGPATSVVRQPGVAIQVLSRQPSRRDGAFVGTLTGLIVAMIALFAVCSATRCFE